MNRKVELRGFLVEIDYKPDMTVLHLQHPFDHEKNSRISGALMAMLDLPVDVTVEGEL